VFNLLLTITKNGKKVDGSFREGYDGEKEGQKKIRERRVGKIR
jgi:hypothetical protein